MDLVGGDRVVLCLFLRDQPLSLKRGHTSRPGRRDGLSVLLVLDITSGKDALDGRLGGTGDSPDVAVVVEDDLRLDQGGSGLVSCVGVSNCPICEYARVRWKSLYAPIA